MGLAKASILCQPNLPLSYPVPFSIIFCQSDHKKYQRYLINSCSQFGQTYTDIYDLMIHTYKIKFLHSMIIQCVHLFVSFLAKWDIGASEPRTFWRVSLRNSSVLWCKLSSFSLGVNSFWHGERDHPTEMRIVQIVNFTSLSLQAIVKIQVWNRHASNI